ncbi:WecB/TagA/CpsF family glycosyltransferase [Lacticaseibacillus zhaodongensis]|uniref:WecB/TagA/CpsF family glycosyltransferase n=1 Tax=Lacticaseibacillus zhaodongensis TaxID=2668065 RepID=UPI0012D2F0F0|nr:WecB/TagA/CpsF family glycosyltransferase [Lacticaseibacillus zhaodongensis]
MSKVDVLGVQFDNYDLAEFTKQVTDRYDAGQGSFIVTANPEIVMYAREHPDYAKLIHARADLVSADGIGVVKGAAMLGTPLKERVTGYDLMLNLLSWANANKRRVYFIGAKQAVNDAAVARVQRDYPDLVVAGTHDGYFDLKDQSVLDAVVAAQPDIVLAALGFPKQENFIAAIQGELPNAVMMGVGGSFDVLSGTVKRAPVWMQNAHLEWFYRLVKEPSRLGRMMVLPRFLMVVRQSVKARK